MRRGEGDGGNADSTGADDFDIGGDADVARAGGDGNELTDSSFPSSTHERKGSGADGDRRSRCCLRKPGACLR